MARKGKGIAAMLAEKGEPKDSERKPDVEKIPGIGPAIKKKRRDPRQEA